MSSFESLTPLNGLDFNNLINARQNNYAWSISDLGDLYGLLLILHTHQYIHVLLASY